VRAGVRLEVVTVAWMAVEAVLAIGAGIVARSVLLTAFGFDSVIELLSGYGLRDLYDASPGGWPVRRRILREWNHPLAELDCPIFCTSEELV